MSGIGVVDPLEKSEDSKSKITKNNTTDNQPHPMQQHRTSPQNGLHGRCELGCKKWLWANVKLVFLASVYQ